MYIDAFITIDTRPPAILFSNCSIINLKLGHNPPQAVWRGPEDHIPLPSTSIDEGRSPLLTQSHHPDPFSRRKLLCYQS
jgi:hypothetical protein